MAVKNKDRNLLIVDDETSVCRALSRMLTNKVDQITYSTSSLEAQTILATQKITHLICDHWFGAGHKLGLDLAVQWRNEFSSIERVVLLTGTDTSMLDVPEEIDFILTKAADSDELLKALNLS